MNAFDFSLIPAYRAHGRGAELRELLREIVASQPENRRAQLELATEHKAAGDTQAALDLLRPLAEDRNYAGQLQSMLTIGRIYLDAGDLAKAEEIFCASRDLFPNNHWPVLALARLPHKRGDLASALSVIASRFDLVSTEGRAMLAQFAAQIKGVDDFARSRLSPYWGAKQVGPTSLFVNAAIIMLVKDEEDIIMANLLHHYDLGFRNYCIINNQSSDRTDYLIQKFRDAHQDALVFSAYDPITGYYQAAKMRSFGEFFTSYCDIAGRDVRWIFYLDADEFITYGGDPGGENRIASLLANDEKTVLTMIWVNCASEDVLERTESDSSVYKTFPLVQMKMSDAATKMAVRRDSCLVPTQGNHSVEAYPFPLGSMDLLSSVDWYLFHFPLRSLDQVRTKVINGGRAYQDSRGLENHGGHWKVRYDRYLERGEEEIKRILVSHIQSIRAGMV